MIRTALLLALLAGVAACGDSETCRTEQVTGVALEARDPSDMEGFFQHPWPSDLRVDEQGRLRLRRFPNPTESSTLEEYLSVIAEQTRGFGTNAAIYAGFSGALSAESVSTNPVDSMSDDSPVILIDIDPSSPERGRRFPLRLRYSEEASVYLPEHHLIALPPYGAPLRGGTTYALLFTDALRAADGDPIEAPPSIHNALRASCADRAPEFLASLYAPLRTFLADDSDELDADRIRGATVFTTQDVLARTRRVAEVARSLPAPSVEGLTFLQTGSRYTAVDGRIQMPSFQTGEVPYNSIGQGGALALDEDGLPTTTGSQNTGLTFAIPVGTMPEAGWPVVLYSHGTFGDHTDVLSQSVAWPLTKLGIAVVGYDIPLHASRDPTGSDPSLTFFNLFNIVAARDNFMQGVADLAVLTHLLSELEISASVTTNNPARFDTTRLGFLGHSQGGLIGSLFAAAEPSLDAAVFSGTAGVLAITLLERKDIVDFKGLLETLLGIEGLESLDEMHPVINLVQTFIEAADPINYSRTFARDPAGGTVKDVLIVEGFLDDQSPPRGHEAFAAAAGAPLIRPAHRNPEASEILGLEPQAAPASANVTTPIGPATLGLIQYPDDLHWVIYDNADANRRYVEFLRSALWDGRGVIVPTEAP